uniref:Uncharacterized protein n=1 Tax=Strongyloides venezuelensis TaxID=75913 RepID=A0A0K0ETT8_STRVS
MTFEYKLHYFFLSELFFCMRNKIHNVLKSCFFHIIMFSFFHIKQVNLKYNALKC